MSPEHRERSTADIPRRSTSGDVVLPRSTSQRPRIGLVCLSAIADDPRVRRQGDLFSTRDWEVKAFGLPGARSARPTWDIVEIGADLPDDNPTIEGDLCAGIGPGDVELHPAVAQGAEPKSRRILQGFAWKVAAWLYWRILIRLARATNRSALPVYRSARFMLRPFRALPGRQAQRAMLRTSRALQLLRLHMAPAQADAIYWTLNDRFEALYRHASRYRPDIWLANDWTALPIAQRLAAEQGVPYAYDTHELAVDEYAQSLRWRLAQRPIIAAIERLGIAGSAVTSCVSQGIADRLQEVYGLRQKPLLIRNMPRYEKHAFRPCGARIEVLYHGVVNVGRGLEACIDSVGMWRSEFRLTIRGPGPADYLASLAERIRKTGCGDRIVLAPPVPMTDLVREAAAFDVGLFALPGHSKQNVHVLPNKFFEYVMAGLALCVSDLPEMTALLRQYRLGHLIPDVSPAAIAKAINAFDRPGIDDCKMRSLDAATRLNWDAEADRLFTAVEHVVLQSRPRPQAAS